MNKVAIAGTGQPMTPTDRSARTPLWSQVKSSLTEMILTQGLGEHAKLPSEADMCRSFGVSRTVIREALAQMVAEGMIYRLQGKGAFVRGRRDEQTFAGSFVGFSGELAEKRQTVTRRILRQEIVAPTPRIQRVLQISPDNPVVAIDRVLSVDGIPRVIVRWAMLQSVVPGLENVQLANRSLYDTISRQYGVRFVRADRWIEALSLGPKDAALLQVDEGHAALCIESAAASNVTSAIEYYTAIYLTNRSRLHFTISSVSP